MERVRRTPLGIAIEYVGAAVMVAGAVLAAPGAVIAFLGGLLMNQSPDEPPPVTHDDQ